MMTTTVRATAMVAVLLGVTAPALGQPKPAPAPAPDRADAKALMQSGLKLLEAKDYLGALAIFKDAYARFPSPKILLNIGTTYKLLDRQADAANTYQHYLDSNDGDAKRRAELGKLLSEIDKTVGIVELTVTPPAAEVQIGADDWSPASTLTIVRVPTTAVPIHARLDGYEPSATTVKVAAGQRQALAIQLVKIEAPVAAPVASGGGGTGIAVVAPEPERKRQRFGVVVLGHIDIPHGWAPLVGLTADLSSHVEVDAAAILGSFKGAYVGARYTFLVAAYRPYVSLGVPMFSSNGLRYGGRAAAGLEYRLNRYLAAMIELGGEYDFNAEMGKDKALFVPALGVTGRL